MSEKDTPASISVAVGSDHAGFALKQDLLQALAGQGYSVSDQGVYSPESADYPDIARLVGEAVAAGRFSMAILVCGTGVGMSIAANKIQGIRAAACSEPYSAMMSRRHNDANVLCIGSRVVGPGLALETARAFLDAEFEGGRHARRVDKIKAMDQNRERTVEDC